MADTVFDANYAERPYHERIGYMFNDYTNAAEQGQNGDWSGQQARSGWSRLAGNRGNT